MNRDEQFDGLVRRYYPEIFCYCLSKLQGDPYGIRAECEKHGFSPLVPQYRPEGFVPTVNEYNARKNLRMFPLLSKTAKKQSQFAIAIIRILTIFQHWVGDFLPIRTMYRSK